MKGLKVVILTHGPFPNDIRIEREVNALLSIGVQVCVIANKTSSCDSGRYNAASIRYITMNFPFGFPIVDLRKFVKLVKKEKPDIIQVCDAPLGLIAVFLSRLTHSTLVYDAHEIWPLLAFYGSTNKIVGLTEVPAYFFSEFIVTKASQKVITVSSGIGLLFAKYYGCSLKKMIVVRNFPSKEEMNKTVSETSLKIPGKFLVVFIGGIDGQRNRELARFIKAIAILKFEKGNNSIVLRIIGGSGVGMSAPPALINLAKKLKISDQVQFIPWVPLKSALQHVASADLCLVASEKNSYTDISLPHKLFQYIFLKKPIITANLNEIREIIREEAIYYTSNDPSALADSLVTAQRTLPQLQLKALTLRTTARSKMNWESESVTYVNAFK